VQGDPPHTLSLVESFGLPQHLLAPIAFDWVEYESPGYVPGSKSSAGRLVTVPH